MKKFGFILAILALVLVFGLAFVGCGGDSAPHDIPALFDSIKGINIWIYAGDENWTFHFYCQDHKAWHPSGSSHITTNFTIANAMQIGGNSYATSEEGVFPTNARALIKKLDSFYSSKYKLPTDPRKVDWTDIGDGTDLVVWYSFSLQRNGSGEYGASATLTKTPSMVYYYQFD